MVYMQGKPAKWIIKTLKCKPMQGCAKKKFEELEEIKTMPIEVIVR